MKSTTADLSGPRIIKIEKRNLSCPAPNERPCLGGRRDIIPGDNIGPANPQALIAPDQSHEYSAGARAAAVFTTERDCAVLRVE